MSVPLNLAALSLVSVVVAACASVAAPLLVKPLKLQIASGKAVEECLSLDAGDRLEWRFDATARVDFNLHFHRGREVVTPVETRNTQQQSGVYIATLREDYCLMWSNAGGVPAFVNGEIRRPRR